MRSPWEFARNGQTGIEVSEIFPQHSGAHIDDFCVIRSMYTDNGNHEPSLQVMNCGAPVTRPPFARCMGHVRAGNGESESPRLHRAVPRLPRPRFVAVERRLHAGHIPGTYNSERCGRAGEAHQNLRNPT